MKYIVKVNAKYLVSIRAESVSNAEHKLLAYNGVWDALAFDREMMKTDTFADAVQECETVSMDEIYEMADAFAKNRVYDRFEAEMPSRYWEPGCEDVNNEDDQIGELNEFADLEIPFE